MILDINFLAQYMSLMRFVKCVWKAHCGYSVMKACLNGSLVKQHWGTSQYFFY